MESLTCLAKWSPLKILKGFFTIHTWQVLGCNQTLHTLHGSTYCRSAAYVGVQLLLCSAPSWHYTTSGDWGGYVPTALTTRNQTSQTGKELFRNWTARNQIELANTQSLINPSLEPAARSPWPTVKSKTFSGDQKFNPWANGPLQ